MEKVRLFLSFSSKDSVVADIVEKELLEILGEQISISRYEKDVEIFGSFREFMNSLKDHDYVLSIISDSYLKSDACLYEIGEIVRSSSLKEKMMFVVLKQEDEKYIQYVDNKGIADIYGFEGRTSYLSYWQEIDEKEYNTLRNLNENIIWKEIDAYRKKSLIRNYDLPVFLDYLSDKRGYSLTELMTEKFLSIAKYILPDYVANLNKYSDISEVLSDYINKIFEITGTDYNQIILQAKTDSHSGGYVVFADKIDNTKKHYRNVINGGIISRAIDKNEIISVDDVNACRWYCPAVLETKSEIVIPLVYNKRVIGAINSEAPKIAYYSQKCIEELISIGKELSALLVNKGYWIDRTSSDLPYISLNVDV